MIPRGFFHRIFSSVCQQKKPVFVGLLLFSLVFGRRKIACLCSGRNETPIGNSLTSNPLFGYILVSVWDSETRKWAFNT
jgi:hypothetical protein